MRSRILAVVCLAACLPLLTCGKAAGGPLPLFDAHAHQMPSTYPEDWLESLWEDDDPSGIVLLGIGNVLVHQQNNFDKVVAFSNFKGVEDVDLGKIKGQLQMGVRGIGEISIRHFESGSSVNDPEESDANDPVESDFNDPKLLAVYDLAKQYGVPVTFHFDYHEDHIGELLQTLPDYEDVVFIWAHAGETHPGILGPLLEQFDNLYIDISSRNPLESFQNRLLDKSLQRLDDEHGTLKPTWKLLFNTYSTQVLYGSDIGPQGRLAQYGQIQEYYRGILAQLDPEVAKDIAYRNAELLFPSTIPEPTSAMLLLSWIVLVRMAHGRCRSSR